MDKRIKTYKEFDKRWKSDSYRSSEMSKLCGTISSTIGHGQLIHITSLNDDMQKRTTRRFYKPRPYVCITGDAFNALEYYILLPLTTSPNPMLCNEVLGVVLNDGIEDDNFNAVILVPRILDIALMQKIIKTHNTDRHIGMIDSCYMEDIDRLASFMFKNKFDDSDIEFINANKEKAYKYLTKVYRNDKKIVTSSTIKVPDQLKESGSGIITFGMDKDDYELLPPSYVDAEDYVEEDSFITSAGKMFIFDYINSKRSLEHTAKKLSIDEEKLLFMANKYLHDNVSSDIHELKEKKETPVNDLLRCIYRYKISNIEAFADLFAIPCKDLVALAIAEFPEFGRNNKRINKELNKYLNKETTLEKCCELLCISTADLLSIGYKKELEILKEVRPLSVSFKHTLVETRSGKEILNLYNDEKLTIKDIRSITRFDLIDINNELTINSKYYTDLNDCIDGNTTISELASKYEVNYQCMYQRVKHAEKRIESIKKRICK